MPQTASRVQVLDSAHTVVVVDELLSPSECRLEASFAAALGYTLAPVTTGLGPVHMPEVRNNQRVILDDHQRAAWLWERIKEHVPAEIDGWRACGLNERLRYYRYTPGQQFAWHRDGCYARSPGERSFLTLLVYLEEDVVGGETEFMGLAVDKVEPRVGRALVFEHPVLHQGAPVVAGRKVVLRTDVMYRL